MFRSLYNSVKTDEPFQDALATQTGFQSQSLNLYTALAKTGTLPKMGSNTLGTGLLGQIRQATLTPDIYTNTTTAGMTAGDAAAVMLNRPDNQTQGLPSQAEEARCRTFVGLKGLERLLQEQAAGNDQALRCGFRYKPSRGIVPEVAQGAYGSRLGPTNSTRQDGVGSGVRWFWFLEDAKKQLLSDSGRNTRSCEELMTLSSLEGGAYAGKLGFCKASRRVIPVQNGRAAYPRDLTLSCAPNDIVVDAGQCPASEEEGFQNPAGGAGSAQCYRAGASLTRDCLLRAVQTAGCSDKGTLYQALQAVPVGATNWDSALAQKKSFLNYQTMQGSLGINPAVLRQGEASMGRAIQEVERIRDTARNSQRQAVRLAAEDLCLRSGAFDNYNFCADIVDTTLLASVDMTCIQRYWQEKGGKPAGSVYPAVRPLSAFFSGVRTWGDYKRKVDELAAQTRSADVAVQKAAYMNFFGTDVGQPPIQLGGQETIWIVQRDGRVAYYRDGRFIALQRSPSAKEISVGPDGLPFILDNLGAMYRLEKDGETWKQVYGRAKDVAVAPNGTLFHIGMGATRLGLFTAGFDLYKWVSNQWTRLQGMGGFRVSADRNGNPYLVSFSDTIWRNDGTSWKQLSGRAKDIGVGADGSVFVIGTNVKRTGGYGIWRYIPSNNGWTEIGGAAVRIAVNKMGNPVVVNDAGNIYIWSPSRRAWDMIGTGAIDVGVGGA